MKTIVIGVTGGIAAFKTVQLVSDLTKQGYDVHVLMSKHAREFVTPLTYETLTHHRVPEMFDEEDAYQVKHVELAKQADVFLIAPASADVIAKVSHGIADDMLTTTFLAADCPKLIAPAMNTHMYENPITQDNIRRCEHYGMQIIRPVEGRLACGDTGSGKLADLDVITDALEQALWTDHCLVGQRLLVSAGPTQEAIDPVRFITNHSSGKMGFAIAKMARRCGAEVTLVAGPHHLDVPFGVTYLPVTSAAEMYETIIERQAEQDIIVKAAAVADYRPAHIAAEKIKKQDEAMSLALWKTQDILSQLGRNKPHGQLLCGFAMETEDALVNAGKKLAEKGADMIVVNDLREHGAGFAVDSNRVTILYPDHTVDLPLMSKEDVAYELCKQFAAWQQGERYAVND